MSMAQAVAQRRMGFFNVTDEGVFNAPDIVMSIIDGVMITRCSHNPVTGIIVYKGFHPAFDPLTPSEPVPQYSAIFDGKVRTWRRVGFGGGA